MSYSQYTGRKSLRINRNNKLLLGVCSGIAEYFGWDVTVVRIATLVSAFFLPTPIFYIIMWFIMRANHDKAAHRSAGVADDRDELSAHSMTDAQTRFIRLEKRLRNLEGHITSRRYNLDREFRELNH